LAPKSNASKTKKDKSLTEEEKSAMVTNTIGIRNMPPPKCLMKLQEMWKCAKHSPMFCYREYDENGNETTHKTMTQRSAQMWSVMAVGFFIFIIMHFKLYLLIIFRQAEDTSKMLKYPTLLDNMLAKTSSAGIDVADGNEKKRKEGSSTAMQTANAPIVNVHFGDFLPQLFGSLGHSIGKPDATSTQNTVSATPRQYTSIKRFIQQLQHEENRTRMMRSLGPAEKERNYLTFGDTLMKCGFLTVKDLVILAVEEAPPSVTPSAHLKQFLLEQTELGITAADIPDRFIISMVVSEARQIVSEVERAH
jgi:hypothetical protein